MLTVKEKRVLKLRYIWVVFHLLINQVGILYAVAIIKCFVELKNSDRLQQFFIEVFNGNRMMFKQVNSFFVIMIGIASFIAIGILITYMRHLKNELESRYVNMKLMSALGYKKFGIIKYEFMYFFWDVLLIMPILIISSEIIDRLINNNGKLKTLAEFSGSSSLFTIEVYAVVIVLMALTIFCSVSSFVIRNIKNVIESRNLS